MNRRAMALTSRSILAALAATCTFALGGCNFAPAEKPPLEGASIGGDFALTGKDDQAVKWSDFAGKYRVVYFGYTFCPDVCPLDMQNIAQGLRLFRKEHADAKPIVPIFITIDPERDTAQVVGKYAANFGKDVVGLTGTPAQIADVAKKWAVYYAKRDDGKPEAYLMDHSRAAYLMGPDGEAIALLPAEQDGKAVAAELAKWVN